MDQKKVLVFALLFTFSLLNFARSATRKNLLEHENSFFHPPKTKVSILNTSQDNLTIHCKSKDDDLGTHVIGFNATYEWKFDINLWHSTLFFCAFNLRGVSAAFDVFKCARDYDARRCQEFCSWIARDDGLYGYTERNLNDIFFSWPNPPNSLAN
ncbi:hypothetical protein L484_024715 [Morus notabilis]|uniref:S-protein homolog n=1 Tax=Morus notabilis TaxID=981085 RepID=W9R4W7_9ROSA|nr:hypothetical protein L484_024715 [Morus notabilis]